MGRRFQWPTGRDLGLFNRPTKNSRRPGTGEKTRRNVSLEFRFRGDPDVGSRIGSFGLVGPEEIEISFDRYASSGNELKGFDAGITYLNAGSILAVLDDGIVQLQFPLCG